MDRNTVIGLSLLFVLFILWQQLMAPSQEQIAAEKRRQDSLELLERQRARRAKTTKERTPAAPVAALPDSLMVKQLAGKMGPFATAGIGQEQFYTLENEQVKITFSNKGGRIRRVLLKQHYKMVQDSNRQDQKQPLYLFDDPNNRFEYALPLATGELRTSALFFNATKEGKTLRFKVTLDNGRYLEQIYTLPENSYQLDYRLAWNGLQEVLQPNTKSLTLNWLEYLDKIEKATQYERTVATINYRPVGENTKRCSPTREYSEKSTEGQPLQWVANTNQFFTTALLAEEPFRSGKMALTALPLEDENLKQAYNRLEIPLGRASNGQFAMHFYLGPNQFEGLRTMGYGLQDIVPFGNNLLGTINRWVIRPIFTFLLQFIGNKGIVILMLTLIVKLLLYPLTYRMIYSQSKMSALKPEMDKLKAKYADDPAKQQTETMKVYREFGVNPLGACLPMLIQMPIWIALYRFFPASIEFRQASFWWSNDLSSYDEFFQLPFAIPFGFGAHISLFALLWTVSTLLYTWYNSKSMDFSAQPGMQYLQYIMPVMFMGFFNSSAAGLSAYMFFSNLLNIGQTLLTKTFVIDEAKVKAQLEENRKKPKKKGGFGERFEKMLQEQQRQQAQREQQNRKNPNANKSK